MRAHDHLMKSRIAGGQVSTAAAEVYERFFVPALFDQWVEPMLAAVEVGPGKRLLDIGTGTGVVARTALSSVKPDGTVVAVDPNEGMLAVARRIAPDLDIRRGVAEQLPFDSDVFDCVTCQFVLMFSNDRARAIAEMARVARPAGKTAVATWAAVNESPGYAAMVDLLGDEIGDWAAEALLAPFCIGTADELESLMRPSFREVAVERRPGHAVFGSLDDWLHTEIRGWTLAERIDDDQFARLRRRADTELSRFVGDDGVVSFATPALIATATAA
jgi:ubiquinone/menaquinone biosynthesis C-methylase UbiE